MPLTLTDIKRTREQSKCKYRNILNMPAAHDHECVCCHDLTKIKSILEKEKEDVKCTTAHPRFPLTCECCIKINYHEYKQQTGEDFTECTEYVL